jgi:hypothetical protein
MIAARIDGRLLSVSRSRQTGDSNNCENYIAKDLGHLDFPLFKLRSCRSMTVFLRLRFGFMAHEREFVSKWQLRSTGGQSGPRALNSFAGNVSEQAVAVTSLMLPCNAMETMIDHLDRHDDGGGDDLRTAVASQG